MKNDLAIDQEWKEKMKDFLVTDTCDKLFSFVYEEYNNKQVFPQLKNIFRAFNETPFSQVRVVIVGQDPYHNDNQANGLSFSVEEGLPLPPSLKNIYKEIEKDIGICKASPSGDLSVWARQGVFLLNAVLTVVAHTPTSHQGKGWEVFTDTVIKKLSDDGDAIVFLLWGNFARSKKPLIDPKKHLILEASHPSPFSAYSGFFGCKHFSQCNAYLEKHGKKPICW